MKKKLVAVAVIAALLAVAAFGVRSSRMRSKHYSQVFAAVSEDPRVVEQLGSPVEQSGWMPAVDASGGDPSNPHTTTTVGLRGPKGSGMLQFRVMRVADESLVVGATVTPEQGEVIPFDTQDISGAPDR